MEVIVLPLGIVAVGLVVLRLGVYTVSSLQRAASQRERDALSLQLLNERINVARRQRETSGLAWNGYRKFEIVRKIAEAEGIVSFYLEPHDGKALARFKAGQYLTFRLKVPGRDKPVVRCYSLSDCHDSKCYRVTIKRVMPPRDAPLAPPGLVSNFFHEQLDEGAIVDVQAPRGHFYLDPQRERPAVLIAGGVGITPILSMVKTVAECGSGRELLIFYGVRDRASHAFREELEKLVENHANLRLIVSYSQPAPEDMSGEGSEFHNTGRVTIELVKSYLPSTNYEFYLCGTPGMMETLNQQLIEWGVAENAILTEAFGPATVSKAFHQPKPDQDTAVACQVTFAKSGVECAWEPSSENLLDFANAKGVNIDSGCRAGNCGTCVVAVKSGQVTYVTEHGADLEDGSCLTCIAAPDGDVVLDA